MEFNDEIKKELTTSKYFDYGIHKVKIVSFNLDTTDDGREFVEVFFVDPEDEEREGSARVWFSTEKGSNYSFNVLRSIYVHNAPEAKKDAARNNFNKVPNTTAMVELLNKNLGGKEMWYAKYLDPQRTYMGNDGITRQSVNHNIYGWEPDIDPELMPKRGEKANDSITEDDVTSTFPGAKSVDEAMDEWGN